MANFASMSAATVALCVAFAGSPLPTAHASDAAEANYLARLNGERRAHGLPPLREMADLDRVAQRWSRQMADATRLSHNPRLTTLVTGWRAVGENVGEGPTIDDLDDAFMASPPHRANVLDRDYTQVGIGTVRADGILWITVDFRRPDGTHQASPSLRPALSSTVTRPTATHSTGTHSRGAQTSRASTSPPKHRVMSYPMLSFGSVGRAVVRLQRLLGIVADGIFGPQTRRAVLRYQRRHGLLIDGIVGPQTWGALTR